MRSSGCGSWACWRARVATYNMPAALRLRGVLDVGALDAALHDVVDRHEALRTVFPVVDGQPFQQVLPAAEIGSLVTVVDGRGLDEAGLDLAVAEAGQYRFDLAVEIPLRASVFTLAPDECVLVVVRHHIAGDGWSTAILGRDLSAAYAARLTGQAPVWRPLPVQYADYTLWQREWLGEASDPGSVLFEQLAYWRTALAEVPEELALPTDRVRPAVASHRGGSVRLQVPAQVHEGLVGLARAEGVTLHMVLQAALAALLSRLGAGTDIPIGTPIAGRTDESLDDLVGFFVNTLVLRTDLSGDPAFTDLLARVRTAALAAHEYQDVPFERLVEELAPVRSMARHPLFQVMLTVQNNTEAVLDLAGLETAVCHWVSPLPSSTCRSTSGRSRTGGLHGSLTFARDLFDEVTAEQIVARFGRVLAAVAADPGQRVSYRGAGRG